MAMAGVGEPQRLLFFRQNWSNPAAPDPVFEIRGTCFPRRACASWSWGDLPLPVARDYLSPRSVTGLPPGCTPDAPASGMDWVAVQVIPIVPACPRMGASGFCEGTELRRRITRMSLASAPGRGASHRLLSPACRCGFAPQPDLVDARIGPGVPRRVNTHLVDDRHAR